MASLVELTVATVALHTPVPELLVYLEYLPAFIRHQLFQKLSDYRLREMEVAWEAAAKLEEQKPREGFDPVAGDRFLFDRETQREWEARLVQCGYIGPLVNPPLNMKRRPRNCRHVFWELEFSTMLKDQHLEEKFSSMLEQRKDVGHVDELMENQKLFVEVVRVLELFSELICKKYAELLLSLRNLQSLEVNYPDHQNFCWETMRRLVTENLHLTELKFVSGSLSDSGFAHLYTALAKPSPAVEKRLDTCRITVLEFVTVEIQPEGYRTLVALVGEMPQLLQLRFYDCVQNFDKKLLINAVLRLPALQRLFLEVVNMLEDDAFDGLAGIRKPLALQCLRLYHNNVALKTVEAICQASMDGILNLERFELSSSTEIRVPAIHALTPMLASPVAGSVTLLTHLDLHACNFGLEGVTSLLLVLGHNTTLTYLNLSHNRFEFGFGHVLADFLLTNSSVTHLKADDVFLRQDDVSARLLTALEINLTLTSLSLTRNQLRNGGASTILSALIKRAQVKPFALVDLSRNQIDLDGLKMIADIFEGFSNANGVTQADSICTADSTNGRDEVYVASWKRQRVGSLEDQRFSFTQCDNIVLIEELRLLRDYLKGYGECTTLIKSIERRVGYLKI